MTLPTIIAILGWLIAAMLAVAVFFQNRTLKLVLEAAEFWKEAADRWRVLAEGWEVMYEGKHPEQPQDKVH